MGRTLNLLEAVVTRARQLHELGRADDALSLLRRHANPPTLPAPIAAEAHHLMGELCLDLQHHRRARKHLSAVLRLRPDDATAHHQMANAIDRDPEVDAQAASRYYRRALELTPDDPALLTDAGLFHVDMGRPEKGLALLRRAGELALDDLDVLQALIVALGELGRFDEAQSELNTARFRHARDPHFLKLVSDLEFQESRRAQKKARSASEARASEAPVVLPFLRVVSDEETKKPTKRFTRRDEASAGRPHFGKAARRSESHRLK